MRLTSELGMDAPLERTWSALLHAEPPDGAWRGILSGYAGSVRLDDLDEDEHTAGFYVQGRELRGQGLASATITARLSGDGGETRLTVETDLRLTGRGEQLDREALQEATDALLGRLAAQLEQELTAPVAKPAAEPSASEAAAAEPSATEAAAEPSASEAAAAEPSAHAPPVATPPVFAADLDGEPSAEALAGRASPKLDLLLAADKLAERALLVVVGVAAGLLIGHALWGRRR